MKNRIRIILITISLAGLCILCLIWGNWSNENRNSTIVINEVCSKSFSSAPVKWKENSDWIELYNASDNEISLEGWSITDNKNSTEVFTFPAMVLQPGEFRVIYATGENYVDENIYLNFKISDGENLYLYNNSSELVDSVGIPKLSEDISYARISDAGGKWAKAYPTPAGTNTDMQLVQTKELPIPEFSLEGGFYYGSQMIELSADEGLDIYYTLDGSEPDQESIYYTEPILLENPTGVENVLSARIDISNKDKYRYAPEVLMDKINVVRAITVDAEGNKSDVITHSYVIDIQDESEYQNLMTVSLCTNPDNLFDYETGKYVLGSQYEEYIEAYIAEHGEEPKKEEIRPNYWLQGRTTEMPASVEIFDENRDLILKQDVGIRIRGNATRELPQKSFGIFAREKYSGTDSFATDIFGDEFKYHRLILMSDRDSTKVRHEVHAELLKDRDVNTQRFVRCNVFLDGEYWGVYSLAEVYSEEYIENHYGIPKDEVIFNDGLLPEELSILCENYESLSAEELYDELIQKIDVDSFIDYYASMLYIDSYDWLPHNGQMWRSATVSEDNPYQDGKWRWMVYDTETAEKVYDRNTFEEGIVTTWKTDKLVQILMTNEEFRQKFVTVFMDLANVTFEESHVINVIDTVFSGYSQAVEAQGVRWGGDWAEDVYVDIEKLYEFFGERFEYASAYLKEEFALQGELISVQLENTNETLGAVKINTVIPMLENRTWSGMYFTDYPITLSVIENEEGSFRGWYDENGKLISDEKQLVLTLSEDVYYRAVFE